MPLIAVILVASSLIASEAPDILGQGQWGLITGDLSAASIAEAKSCQGPSIGFTFGEHEARVVHSGGATPAPAEVYRAVRVIEAAPHSRIELFYAPTDRAAARRYLYDPSVKSLMRLMPDGDGDALYVLCD